MAAVALTLALAAGSISDFLYHTNPSTAFQFEYFNDPGEIILNTSNFLFSITDQDPDFFLESAILSFNLRYSIYTRYPNGTLIKNNTNIPLIRCTKDYWKGFEVEFDALNMSNRLCPSQTFYNISGQFLTWTYQFFSIDVVKCKNRTDQPDIVCKPKAELDAKLPAKDITISFTYTDNIINLNDWENPVTRFVTDLHWDIAPTVLAKKTDIFVSQYDIITDDNFLLPGYWTKNLSTFQINGVERPQNYAPQPDNPDQYFKLYLRKSSSFTTATRTYLKIGDLFGTIGGLGQFWVALLGVFAILYNRKLFEVRMANYLYEFDNTYDSKPASKPGADPSAGAQGQSKRKNCLHFLYFLMSRKCCRNCCRKRKNVQGDPKQVQENNNNQAKQVPISGTKLSPSSSILGGSNQENPTSKVKLYLRSFQEYSRGIGKKMEWTFWDFLLGLITCGRRKKDRLISLAAEKIQEDTDIIHILKRVQDLEKLKELFFNEHQRRVFGYSRPPLISLEDQELERLMKLKRQKDLAKQNPKQGFIRNSIQKFRSRRTNLLKKDPLIDVDNMTRFAQMFDSYRKVRRSQGRLNKDLIRLLDLELEKALYDLDFDLREDAAFSHEYFKIMAIRVFEDLFFKAKRKKKMCKEDAANLIARRWLQASKKRKAKEVRKAIRLKTIANLERKATTTNIETTVPEQKPQRRKEESRDDFLQEYEREDLDYGNGDSDDLKKLSLDYDFEDDEILNEDFNYGEDIDNMQTPKYTHKHASNLRTALATSPRVAILDDSRIEIRVLDLQKTGTKSITSNSQFRRSNYS